MSSHGISFTDFVTFFTAKAKVVDMASAHILGGGVSRASDTLITDVFSPIITLLTGGSTMDTQFTVLKSGPNGPYATATDAQKDGAVVIKYGRLGISVINLIVQALALYLIIGAWQRCIGDVCTR